MNQGWKNKRHTLVLALRIFAHYNKLHFATTTHTDTHTHTLLPKTATLQIHSEKSYCFFLYSVPIVYVLRVSFNNYVDSILPFCDPPTPAWTVFIPWAWAKTNIFDPSPLILSTKLLNGPLGTIQVLSHHVFNFFRPTHPTLWWFTVL